MGGEEQLVVQLLVMVAFGVAAALIAAHKGRNPIGWFFVGFFVTCIGLIIVLCMSNLKEEEARWRHAENERRRLREQLKQERLKNEAFQGHVRSRLDVHDEALGMNTRMIAGAEAEAAPPAEIAPPLAAGSPEPPSFRYRQWFVDHGDHHEKPVGFPQLKALYETGQVNETNLVWSAGMKDWMRIADVPGLLEELR
ncbi:MAG: DUF4339 domain-containing protein [Planctomycetes bacterium]|nr:DUF4339 domain-containing protein [Planctomycetota bacterium]